MHATRSLHGGWGRRAPLWLHRRHRGGALEVLRRCLVDKPMPVVLVERRCRRRQSWCAHTFPYFACPEIWAYTARTFMAGNHEGVEGTLGHAEYESQEAAEWESVRAPSNGVHLLHCRCRMKRRCGTRRTVVKRAIRRFQPCTRALCARSDTRGTSADTCQLFLASRVAWHAGVRPTPCTGASGPHASRERPAGGRAPPRRLSSAPPAPPSR